MKNYNQALVEEVITALDKMLLSSDKIFEERKYSNYRFAHNRYKYNKLLKLI